MTFYKANLIVFITLIGLSISFQIHAKQTDDAAQKFVQEKLKQEEIEHRAKQSGTQIVVPKSGSAVIFAETPCVWINRIRIQGNHKLTNKQLHPLSYPYVNHCLGRRTINALLAQINHAYIQRGYITSRAFLPKQNLSKNQLTIVVVEGQVERIDINQNHRSDRLKLYMAMPQNRHEILNLRQLEQGVDQLNRVPSTQAQMKIIPGNAIGQSKVFIQTQEKDWFRGRIGYDNEGSQNDKNRLRLGLEVDNLLALNERSSVYLISSKNTNALALNTSVPMRNFNVTGALSYAEYLQIISPVADVFGFSISQSLGLDYLAYRDANSQFKLGIGVNRRLAKRYLLDVALTPQKSANYRVFVNRSYRNQGQFWLFECGFTQGLDIQNQDRKISNNATDPVRSFRKLDSSLTYRAQFAQWYLDNNVSLQLSFDRLYGQEQVSLGGKASVAGFGLHFVSGDSGIVHKSTLHSQWLKHQAHQMVADNWFKKQFKYSLLRLNPSVFVQSGAAYNLANEKADNLLSAGIGLGYQYAQFSLQSSLAYGLYSSTSAFKPSLDFYLSASLQAF